MGNSVGLSPRARGSRPHQWSFRGTSGSIPAGAGKPPRGTAGRCAPEVYPRGRGEADRGLLLFLREQGLSPRARGSRADAWRPVAATGSIPAGAGKPRARCVHRRLLWVYPRGRGEAAWSRPKWGISTGLSPRARGSLDRQPRNQVVSGSIPAGAGKPVPPSPCGRSHRVYPRGRGEATEISLMLEVLPGLSPRARGSHRRILGRHERMGSIPAGAGKPCSADAA